MIKKSPTKQSTAKKAPTKKKPAPKKTAPRKAKPEEPSITILQTTKCQTVSGKSTLTFHLGTDDKDNIFLRVHSNTGGGHFSNEWVPLDIITAALDKVPADQPITSIHLIPLFQGKSVNTPGYLVAVLLKEGLLEPFEGKKRQYSYTGTDAFLAKIEKLKARKKAK